MPTTESSESLMAKKKQEEEKWAEGRTRAVRCVLTEEEHLLVRQAAAVVDHSVSRFAVEAVVEKARRVMEGKGKKA